MSSILIISLLLTVSTGCRSQDRDERQAVVPSPVPSATPSVEASALAKQEALAAYNGMWGAFIDAAEASDP